MQVLVCNAGITRDNLLLAMSEQEFAEVLNTNLMGAVRAVKAVLPAMVKARWGRIIMVGSTQAFWGSPGVTNYSSSKAAMAGFCRSLAWEVGRRKITVNVVYPGLIDTDMTSGLEDRHREYLLNTTAMHRSGTPAEVAAAVRFLAGEEASFITGALLPVSGGQGLGH